MNVLLVDDQPAVIESLKREIRWEELGVEKVYTALSAREAKMAMNNFDIDALLTDIEMPEEDGLQLFRWMREHYPQIEGGFDYILQPVRGEEVERVLRGVAEKLARQHEIRRIRSTAALIRSHRSDLLDGLLRKLELGSEAAANRAFGEFLQVCRAERGEVDVYPSCWRSWTGAGSATPGARSCCHSSSPTCSRRSSPTGRAR